MDAHAVPTDVVRQFFGCLGARDPRAGRRYWSDDAVWHLSGRHTRARDYPVDEYLTMLTEWFASYPAYSGEIEAWTTSGEEVVSLTLTSTGGEAPARASGLMVYRVVDGLIREGWGIPTFADGQYAF
jgi:ketosteroid isomerase-like protein